MMDHYKYLREQFIGLMLYDYVLYVKGLSTKKLQILEYRLSANMSYVFEIICNAKSTCWKYSFFMKFC